MIKYDGYTEEMPSVTPQQKIGRWILSGGYWRCSDCNQKALLKLDKVKGGCREYIPIRSNFCPNCGARMIDKQENKNWVNFAEDLIPIIDDEESEE